MKRAVSGVWGRVLLVMLMIGSGTAAAASAPAGDCVVLDSGGVWRMFHVLKPPLIAAADGTSRPLTFGVKWLDTPSGELPAGWTQPEASDRGWMRGPARRSARTPYLSHLALRGKFEVTDPAAVGELSLALEYCGGAIVYFNGSEIGRGNVVPGKDGADATAEAYPAEAFLDAAGKLIEGSKNAPAVRNRSLKLTLPKGSVKKGLNVLGIELVRAPYPETILSKHPGGVGGVSKDPGLSWDTCEIHSIRLSAKNGDGLIPDISRPAGLQVWNGDPLAGDVDVDYGDRTEALAPIAISSPRNGALFGKVIVGRDKPIKNLSVIAGELKSGAGAIPPSAVSFLYGVAGAYELQGYDAAPAYPDGAGFLTTLLTQPPKEAAVVQRNVDGSRANGAVIPVWVQVKVPKSAAAGLYKGGVTISMEGEAAVKVPLEVKVLPWTIPDPQAFRTWVELIQSPDTLAVEYKVPLWSERHFALIGQSFSLISQTGARSLYVPAIAHTNLGNAESMIRWIKKPGGKYDWDFSVMEKYLDVAKKQLGTPKLIVLQVWEVYMNTKDSTGRRFGEILAENQKETGGAPLVTFLGADGKTENGTIPKLGDPASKAIWGELIGKVKEHLKKRGLEKTLQLGMFTDSTPNKEDTKMFLDIAPDLAWVQQGHNAYSDLNGIGKVGYTATWWSQIFADDLVNLRAGAVDKATYKEHPVKMTSLFGWNRARLDAYYPRMPNENYPASYWDFLCETAITGDFYRGIGRVGADYWMAVRAKDGRRSTWVDERFIEVAGYLHSLHSYVLEPQPDGPASTTRLAALEMGIQACEARIYIEDAMVNRHLAAKSPELAKRCKEFLDERLQYMWKGLDNMQFGGWGVTAWRFQPGVSGHAWLLNSGYQQREENLYALAGEVEKAMAK